MRNQSSYSSYDIKEYQLIKKFNLPKQFPVDFIVLDFETTGLSPIVDEIIQIGALLYIDGKPVKRFEQNINPNRKIPEKIIRLTGIKQEDVENAPLIPDVLPRLLDFIKH